MNISSQFPGFDQFWISVPEFLELREWTHAFSSVGAYTTGESNLSAADRPQRVRMMAASADLFTTLGVGALLGRTFDAGETRPGAAPVALLSYGLWQSAFGGDPGAGGSTASRSMASGEPSSASCRPRSTSPTSVSRSGCRWSIDPATANRGGHFLYLIGRLSDVATLVERSRRARDAARPVAGSRHRRTRCEWPSSRTKPHHSSSAHRAASSRRSSGRRGRRSGCSQGAVVLVLLIACANLSTMLLSRAESRRKEFALRWALGAGRVRLLRQLIVEGCLLSIGGRGARTRRRGRWPARAGRHVSRQPSPFRQYRDRCAGADADLPGRRSRPASSSASRRSPIRRPN